MEPTRLKRAGLSLVSALAAEVVFGVAFQINGTPGLRREQLFGFLYFSSILIIPGWLIALPILVLPQRAISLPIWQLALIGISIGPIIMIAVALYAGIAGHSGFAYNRAAFNLLYLATGIAFLTTAIYLLVLKLITRGRDRQTVQ